MKPWPKVIELNIVGIKCDMPNCNWRDETARYEDYRNWLNRPCPVCRGNLLTQRDFEFARKLFRRIAVINFLFGWLTLLPGRVGGRRSFALQTDGRGIPMLERKGPK